MMQVSNPFIKSKILEHIEKFDIEFREIVVFDPKFNQNSDTINSPGVTNINYYNNGWYWPTFNNNPTYITNKVHTEEDNTGKHPIVFLLGAGVVAFSATYAMATDGYIEITKRFKKLDEIMNLMDSDFRGSKYDHSYINLKKNYGYLKEKIFEYYKPSFHSKLGIIGSGLLGTTFFWPLGYIALTGSIIGFTGFGCYWLWHKLANEYEYKKGIIENIHNINNFIIEIKASVRYDMDETSLLSYDIYSTTNIYPKIHPIYISGTQDPSAPLFVDVAIDNVNN